MTALASQARDAQQKPSNAHPHPRSRRARRRHYGRSDRRHQGATYVHDATTAYACDAASNKNFTFTGARTDYTGNGSGSVTASRVTFTGTRPTDGYAYTIAGNITGPSGAWELTASTDTLGQVGASAEGSFSGLPDCVADPVVPVGNHGEYVSGAVKAGIKGKDLAAIARDVTLVGPYKC